MMAYSTLILFSLFYDKDLCQVNELQTKMGPRLFPSVLVMVHIISCYCTVNTGTRVNSSLLDVLSRRYLLSAWSSWEQHAACLTTCLAGYENITSECCATGNNMVCFQLPMKLINESIGLCEDKKPSEASTVSVSKSTSGDIPSPTHSQQQFVATTSEWTKSTHNGIVPTKPQQKATERISPTQKRHSTTAILSTTVTSRMTSLITSPSAPSYCQNRYSISCGFTFKVVCGSDGKIYANTCMLALGRCDDPTLTQVACSG